MREEVLDIGCGTKREGTVNTDINRYVRPDLVCDGHYLPFKNETFNRCVLRHIIEHAENPEQLVDECYRTLRINGLVQVTFPNFASFTVLLDWLDKNPKYADDLILGSKTERMQWQWQWHRQLCTTATVMALLNNHGFDAQKIIGHPPSVGSKGLRLLGSIIVKVFPGRAGNVTMIAKKRVWSNH